MEGDQQFELLCFPLFEYLGTRYFLVNDFSRVSVLSWGELSFLKRPEFS